MTDYKATPEQWAQCEDWVRSSVVGASDACILELRTRVETLEAAAHKHIVETNSDIVALFTRVESLEAAERQASTVHQISKPLKLTPEQEQQVRDLLAPNSKPTPNPGQTRSSLVERVAIAISRCEDSSCWDDEAVNWEPEARAAIREVAAWLREDDPFSCDINGAAAALEQEAER
jgi:hypothetical protein